MVLGFAGLGLENDVLAEDGGLLQVLPFALHLFDERGDHSENVSLS